MSRAWVRGEIDAAAEETREGTALPSIDENASSDEIVESSFELKRKPDFETSARTVDETILFGAVFSSASSSIFVLEAFVLVELFFGREVVRAPREDIDMFDDE